MGSAGSCDDVESLEQEHGRISMVQILPCFVPLSPLFMLVSFSGVSDNRYSL